MVENLTTAAVGGLDYYLPGLPIGRQCWRQDMAQGVINPYTLSVWKCFFAAHFPTFLPGVFSMNEQYLRSAEPQENMLTPAKLVFEFPK